MNKTELFEATGRYVTQSALKPGTGSEAEYMVVGKYGCIEPIDGIFDVYLCNMADMDAGLPPQLLTYRLKALSGVTKRGGVHKLDGEAWFRVSDLSEIKTLAHCLHIKRRPLVSEAQIAAGTAALWRNRNGC